MRLTSEGFSDPNPGLFQIVSIEQYTLSCDYCLNQNYEVALGSESEEY